MLKLMGKNIFTIFILNFFDCLFFLCIDFQTLFYIHMLAVILGALTVRWYSALWFLFYVVVGWILVPGFTRIGGYVGNTFHL